MNVSFSLQFFPSLWELVDKVMMEKMLNIHRIQLSQFITICVFTHTFFLLFLLLLKLNLSAYITKREHNKMKRCCRRRRLFNTIFHPFFLCHALHFFSASHSAVDYHILSLFFMIIE